MDPLHVFPLIFSIGGYCFTSGKIPGFPIAPEELQAGDLLAAKDLEKQLVHYALYLGSEQVFWMDHRMQTTDLDDWEEFLNESTPSDVEVSMHRLLN